MSTNSSTLSGMPGAFGGSSLARPSSAATRRPVSSSGGSSAVPSGGASSATTPGPTTMVSTIMAPPTSSSLAGPPNFSKIAAAAPPLPTSSSSAVAAGPGGSSSTTLDAIPEEIGSGSPLIGAGGAAIKANAATAKNNTSNPNLQSYGFNGGVSTFTPLTTPPGGGNLSAPPGVGSSTYPPAPTTTTASPSASVSQAAGAAGGGGAGVRVGGTSTTATTTNMTEQLLVEEGKSKTQNTLLEMKVRTPAQKGLQPGKLRAYIEAPLSEGMSWPPQSAEVKKDLRKYLLKKKISNKSLLTMDIVVSGFGRVEGAYKYKEKAVPVDVNTKTSKEREEPGGAKNSSIKTELKRWYQHTTRRVILVRDAAAKKWTFSERRAIVDSSSPTASPGRQHPASTAKFGPLEVICSCNADPTSTEERAEFLSDELPWFDDFGNQVRPGISIKPKPPGNSNNSNKTKNRQREPRPQSASAATSSSKKSKASRDLSPSAQMQKSKESIEALLSANPLLNQKTQAAISARRKRPKSADPLAAARAGGRGAAAAQSGGDNDKALMSQIDAKVKKLGLNKSATKRVEKLKKTLLEDCAQFVHRLLEAEQRREADAVVGKKSNMKMNAVADLPTQSEEKSADARPAPAAQGDPPTNVGAPKFSLQLGQVQLQHQQLNKDGEREDVTRGKDESVLFEELCARGEALEEQNELALACREYRAALGLTPLDPNWKSKLEQRIAYLEKQLLASASAADGKNDPNKAGTNNFYSKLLGTRSARTLSKPLKPMVRFVSHYNLSLRYWDIGKATLAIKECEHAVGILRRFGLPMTGLIDVLDKMTAVHNKYRLQEGRLEAAMRRGGDGHAGGTAETRYRLGVLYFDKRMLECARRELRQAEAAMKQRGRVRLQQKASAATCQAVREQLEGIRDDLAVLAVKSKRFGSEAGAMHSSAAGAAGTGGSGTGATSTAIQSQAASKKTAASENYASSDEALLAYDGEEVVGGIPGEGGGNFSSSRFAPPIRDGITGPQLLPDFCQRFDPAIFGDDELWPVPPAEWIRNLLARNDLDWQI